MTIFRINPDNNLDENIIMELYLLSKMSEYGRINGMISFQKYVCLHSLFRVPGFRQLKFEIYLFGPYCEEINNLIHKWIRKGFVHVKIRINGEDVDVSERFEEVQRGLYLMDQDITVRYVLEADSNKIDELFLNNNVDITFKSHYENIINLIDRIFLDLSEGWMRELAVTMIYIMINDLTMERPFVLSKVRRLKYERFKGFEWFKWEYLDQIWDYFEEIGIFKLIKAIISDKVWDQRKRRLYS